MDLSELFDVEAEESFEEEEEDGNLEDDLQGAQPSKHCATYLISPCHHRFH